MSETRRTHTFETSQHLAELFGQNDCHLAQIEQALDVHLSPRGTVVAMEGEDESVNVAELVLEALHVRLATGQEVTPGDVDGALRLALGGVSLGEHEMDRHMRIQTQKRSISPRSPRQVDYIKAMRDSELVFGLGPAGTGKTYLAAAMGVALMLEGKVDRIILSRPAVEAGERLGFLPGDLREKVDPYLRPLYDALFDTMIGEQAMKKLESGEIEVAPLAFMRGRTLANAFVILDEAQNATSTQMKMFLTRLGENSRMVVTGDPSQVDLPRGAQSGLVEAERILGNVKGVDVVRFTDADVVRHPLVTRIVRAYNKAEGGAPGGGQGTKDEGDA
jgi:phosphate starvation-inducible PhoH-like protein